jgi:hypothetical protein
MNASAPKETSPKMKVDMRTPLMFVDVSKWVRVIRVSVRYCSRFECGKGKLTEEMNMYVSRFYDTHHEMCVTKRDSRSTRSEIMLTNNRAQITPPREAYCNFRTEYVQKQSLYLFIGLQSELLDSQKA